MNFCFFKSQGLKEIAKNPQKVEFEQKKGEMIKRRSLVYSKEKKRINTRTYTYS